ncbi:hypothetical protein AAFC00_003782 [Neodothiora populina]|uniref:RING-type E3 ubiquitin transferase n=1 Tax=Neodothiora populina TaxID=2781224 RepID=A0ABR3PFC0_9PEZI
MADSSTAPAQAPSEGNGGGSSSSSSSNNRGRNGRGRGGRGGRGGNKPTRNGEEQREAGEKRQRGEGGNRGRGRARGGGGGGGGTGKQSPRAENQPPSANEAGVAMAPGKARMLGATNVDGAGENKAQQDGDDVEAEVCFICASPVVHNSVAPCNHRTCHICALRLRALYKTKACAHCRSEAQTVIFTDDATKRFQDYTSSDFFQSDTNLGIQYENPDIFEDTVLLLRYNCPDPSCDVACLGWPDLHRHVKSVHHKSMCDLCTRNKKVFTHEHELFTKEELRKHEKYGDDNPGAVDQSGFKGHPECGFCRQRFYGDDELYAHCRDRHERCHICDRRNGGRQPQYYLDYNALEVHFRKDHFVCPDQECLEKKFVVFDSEMDLKAHQLEAHPNGLTKDARRDARRVDISGFDYRQPHQEERPQRRERNRGRGRDPNAEPIPASSAQPMRRDELAYQRQMAIQSAQSVTTRNFGGSLTQPAPSEVLAARAPAHARDPPAVTVQRPAPNPFPALGEAVNSMSSQPPSSSNTPRTASPDPSLANLSPQEQARRLRHNAVTERAANLVRNDQSKLAEFRAKVSAYRQSQLTADQLIDAFFVLFDTSSAELGKLVKELADIFELPAKRDALLKAWGNWKAINEDYPSLPMPSTTGGPSSSGGIPTAASVLGHSVGINRVLKLKSSTQKSSQSAVGKNAGWGTAAAGPMFPPLSSSSKNSASAIAARMSGTTTTSSSSGRASPAPTPNWLQSAPASARPSPPISRTGSAATLAPPRKDAFPALPKAAKPTSTVFSPGYTGAGVRRLNNAAPTGASPWSGSAAGASSSSGAVSPAGHAEEDGVGKKVKGRKGKQQVLFNWG